jgi:hypothetical protein
MTATTYHSVWDLSVRDAKGQLVLIVEVKRKLNASTEWATKLRRNILAHGTFPNAPYFMMVFPDKFYLWQNADFYPIYQKPTYTVDALPILQPYYDQAEVEFSQISSQSLELIVASWLGEIIYFTKSSEDIDESQHWLIDSGLNAAIAGGQLDQQVAK